MPTSSPERCGGQQSFPTPITSGRPRTLYPESGNRSQRRGIEESGNRIRGSGYGLRGKGAVVVVLRRRCFFSELRVITLITKKYSILKTTTTTDYHILNLPPLAVPADKADQFFSQHPIIYRPTHPKNRTPTGGVSPLSRDPPKADSPLPFPDSGMLLRGSLNLCDTKQASSTHERLIRAVFSPL